MSYDYRVTQYCPAFRDIPHQKSELVKLIRQKHPRAQDMHALISPNNGEYKLPFMLVYNCKCSYCGVSLDIIPKDNFEIDHYIYKKNKEKFKTVSEAGCIENLVLACRRCNHNKGDYNIPEDFLETLFPDSDEIKCVFTRNPNYEIVISEKYTGSPTIAAFYNALQLDHEVHKLDYLLLKMIGLQNATGDPVEYHTIGKAAELLRKKRNML